MFPFTRARFFSPWTDPVSGVTSWLLTEPVAPIRQSFYFTNPSLTPDGRYLWFYAAYPPAGDANYGRILGVVDFAEQSVRVFPETAFLDASPGIDLCTDEVYWVTGTEVWARGPRATDRPRRVHGLPDELVKQRRPHRVSTHLTWNADRTALGLDAQIGAEWFVGDFPLDGSPVRIWQTFDRCYNHAQFHPTDPDLLLIAQDHWFDPDTGEQGAIPNRHWLIRRGETAQPLLPATCDHSHEWWGADGRSVWYVGYRTGTWRYDLATRTPTCIWPAGTCHTHATVDERYLVGDIGPYAWAEQGCRVTFFNVATGKAVDIASALPVPAWSRAKYHLDPHPQFCLQDQVIVYTTTLNGEVTVAVTDVAPLVERTQ